MAMQGTPIDEMRFAHRGIIDWWVSQGGQPMDENMIHRYLTESPFFDYTTKNGLIFTQARTIPAEDMLVRDRRAFEERLAKQNGTEYMIVGTPQQVEDAPQGTTNGMYVLRKQDRQRKRTSDGKVSEELTTLGTYYIVGENMFQAPSVGDVVGNRVLAAATSLTKFFEEAASLPNFSPTTGYSYTPLQASAQATIGAGNASPSRSRDGSVVPGAESLSQGSGSLAPEQEGAHTKNSFNARDARMLEYTLNMVDQFGDDYTDENPIIGEPGHFSFTSSTTAVKKRKAEEEAAAAERLRQSQQGNSSHAATPKANKPPSPPAVMTEAKNVKDRDKERRGGKTGEKVKRKKSRANVQTPTTPGPNAQQPPSAA